MMDKSEVSALTLLAVVIAGALAGRMFPAVPWSDAVVGLLLLIVLFAYDRGGYRDTWQSVAFGAVCGYCAMLIGASALTLPVLKSPAPATWLPMIWAGATIIFTAMDRVRMNTRAMTIRPVEPVSTPLKQEFETPVRRATPVREEKPAPVAETVAEPSVAANGARPEPQRIEIPQGAGKPATIYLNLVGEGLAVLRTVQAEHMGKDYYRIVDQVPEGEKWEFQPGQIVRCRKQRLSTGKALVAFEEAPRAR
ncbi:MAG: hypothetical protein JOZ62_18405 [Acidobacteriaceae bacterium]|nr:hypothetical protein [Acidobacteriaceae bacterium]